MSETGGSGGVWDDTDAHPAVAGGPPQAALERVFEKLARMSASLLEIEEWFDARSQELRAASRSTLGSLEDVDRVIRRESGAG